MINASAMASNAGLPQTCCDSLGRRRTSLFGPSSGVCRGGRSTAAKWPANFSCAVGMAAVVVAERLGGGGDRGDRRCLLSLGAGSPAAAVGVGVADGVSVSRPRAGALPGSESSSGSGAHETRFCLRRLGSADEVLAQGLETAASMSAWVLGRCSSVMVGGEMRRLLAAGCGEGVMKSLNDLTDRLKSGVWRPDCFASGVDGRGGSG